VKKKKLSRILPLLPRTIFKFHPDELCINWHEVARRSANWLIDLRNEEGASRFLSALLSNEVFIKAYPGWPLLYYIHVDTEKDEK
jgi:hypothetical protein